MVADQAAAGNLSVRIPLLARPLMLALMFLLPSAWRRDALRTNLWFVPMLEVLGAIALYLVTHAVDAAAYRGTVTLPVVGASSAPRMPRARS